MKKVSALVLVGIMAASLAGCAKKTASEQLNDDMKKMQSDMSKSAKKMQDELR